MLKKKQDVYQKSNVIYIFLAKKIFVYLYYYYKKTLRIKINITIRIMYIHAINILIILINFLQWILCDDSTIICIF